MGRKRRSHQVLQTLPMLSLLPMLPLLCCVLSNTRFPDFQISRVLRIAHRCNEYMYSVGWARAHTRCQRSDRSVLHRSNHLARVRLPAKINCGNAAHGVGNGSRLRQMASASTSVGAARPSICQPLLTLLANGSSLKSLLLLTQKGVWMEVTSHRWK